MRFKRIVIVTIQDMSVEGLYHASARIVPDLTNIDGISGRPGSFSCSSISISEQVRQVNGRVLS